MKQLLRILPTATLAAVSLACGSPSSDAAEPTYPPGTLMVIVDSVGPPGPLHGVRLPDTEAVPFPAPAFPFSDAKALPTPGEALVVRIDLGRFNVLTGAAAFLVVDSGTVNWASPSPDGSSVLIQRALRGRTLEVLNPDGSIRQVLLDRPAPSMRPVGWLDNAVALVDFADTMPPFDQRFHRVDLRTGVLTPTDLVNLFGTVSADGRWLAVYRNRPAEPGRVDVIVMNVETRDERHVATVSSTLRVPVWSPDGRWLAVTRIEETRYLVDVYEIATGRRIEVGDRTISTVAVSWASW